MQTWKISTWLLLLALIATAVDSFVSKSQRGPLSNSHHFGIAEWRDLEYNGSPISSATATLPKAISILPFPFSEVLLQGETKELRLYEDRFLQLFDDVMLKEGGMVGMGLLAQSGLIQTMPLCEIEAHNRMDGFGIFLTIRVVGRSQLLSVTQQEPFLKGVCVELADEFPQSLGILNLLATTIEQTLLTISNMEFKLKTLEIETNANDNSDDNDDDYDDDDPINDDMQMRLNVAKLEDQFYDDDDDSDDEEELDRSGRFNEAYEIAMETDTQGYLSSSSSSSTSGERSPKELAALSWAAFCTELEPEIDATFRIQAMDETNMLERLKLASRMLKEKKLRLETQLKKSGFKKDDEEL